MVAVSSSRDVAGPEKSENDKFLRSLRATGPTYSRVCGVCVCAGNQIFGKSPLLRRSELKMCVCVLLSIDSVVLEDLRVHSPKLDCYRVEGQLASPSRLEMHRSHF